jgi:hypothetical protein
MSTLFMELGADISECSRYRWSLYRCWNHALPLLGWIMLNPSTADASVDDPTIRRCIGFARDWGFGGIEVRNLFAWRATDPSALREAIDPVGVRNDEAINGLAILCPKIVCAWGAHPFARQRANQVAQSLRHRNAHTVCLGMTKGGCPKHPLCVPSDAETLAYPSEASS